MPSITDFWRSSNTILLLQSTIIFWNLAIYLCIFVAAIYLSYSFSSPSRSCLFPIFPHLQSLPRPIYPWQFVLIYHHLIISPSSPILSFYISISCDFHPSAIFPFSYLNLLLSLSIYCYLFSPFSTLFIYPYLVAFHTLLCFSHLSPFLLLIYYHFISHLLLLAYHVFDLFLFFCHLFFIFSHFLPFACYLFSSIFCLVLVFTKLLLSVILTHCFSGLRTGEWRVGFQPFWCAVCLSRFAVEEKGFQKSSLFLTRASTRLWKGKVVLVVGCVHTALHNTNPYSRHTRGRDIVWTLVLIGKYIAAVHSPSLSPTFMSPCFLLAARAISRVRGVVLRWMLSSSMLSLPSTCYLFFCVPGVWLGSGASSQSSAQNPFFFCLMSMIISCDDVSGVCVECWPW